MKEVDIVRDILVYRISNQVFYNDSMIKVRNPEARQLFAQMRDEEMRAIVKLQQKIERMENPPRLITKIFSSKSRY